MDIRLEEPRVDLRLEELEVDLRLEEIGCPTARHRPNAWLEAAVSGEFPGVPAGAIELRAAPLRPVVGARDRQERTTQTQADAEAPARAREQTDSHSFFKAGRMRAPHHWRTIRSSSRCGSK